MPPRPLRRRVPGRQGTVEVLTFAETRAGGWYAPPAQGFVPGTAPYNAQLRAAEFLGGRAALEARQTVFGNPDAAYARAVSSPGTLNDALQFLLVEILGYAGRLEDAPYPDPTSPRWAIARDSYGNWTLYIQD